MSENPNPPTNPRKMKQDNERKMVLMTLVTLIGVGSLVIAVVYEPSSLITALPCLVGGGVLIWGMYLLLNKLEKRLEDR